MSKGLHLNKNVETKAHSYLSFYWEFYI